MFQRRKKRILERLASSFGAVKTEGFNFEHIQRFYRNKDTSGAFHTLSDQTCHDLDLDLFFCYVDRTSSKIGQQYLYERLRTFEGSRAEWADQEKLIQYLIEHPKDRVLLQYHLQKLNHQQAYYVCDLFQKEIEKKPKWYFVIPILSIAAISSVVLSLIQPQFILLLLGLIPIHALLHYGLKRKTNLFLNSVPALLTLGATANRLLKFPFIQAAFSKVDPSIQVISTIRRRMAFFKLEQKVDSDMEAAYWFLLELIKISFLLEPLLLFSSLNKIRAASKELEDVYQFVGKVDSLVSIASLRAGLDEFCIPTIDPQIFHIEFESIRHPLIPNCVANTIKTHKSVLLTGSNMSGKTTFIRSIGLNYISGMTLNTCFASSAILPLAQLFSVIRLEDDLMNSSSYFYSEVSAIKQIIETTEKDQFCLILLDELFKGTNTVERIASAKAVLSYLMRSKCQVLVSTHDIELTKMLHDDYELLHFSESISESNIHFDYTLKKGAPAPGNAIRILEFNNYPKTLVAEAKSLVDSWTFK